MKKVLFALAALLTLAAGGADAALTAWAPADHSLALLVDVRRLMGSRDVRRTVASPGVAEQFAEVERVGLRIALIRELAVFQWDDHWYGVMLVEDAEALRKSLEQKSSDPAAKVAAERVAGATVYRLKRPPRKDGRHKRKELCLIFPGGDVVVLAKRVEVEAFLKCPKLDHEAAAKLADTDAEVWGEYHDRDNAKRSGRDDDDGPDVRLKHGSLMVRLTGAGRDNIEAVAVGVYHDPAGARSMSTALPGIMAFFTGLVFAEDPEGGDELVRALNTEVSGDRLMLSIKATPELVRRFLRAQESFFGGGKHAPAGAKVRRRHRGR